MIKSTTKISKQAKTKRNPELVRTILDGKKNDKWLEVAGFLSGTRKNRISINLGEINSQSKDGETIVVPGKVLSQGEIEKKIKLVAFKFSEEAIVKLSKAKINFSYISDEIKSNPSAKEIKILR